MITEDKVIEIYCLADDFCKVFSAQVKNHQLTQSKTTRKYYRIPTLSDAEIITILVLFHLEGYRCLKHFYLHYVCQHMLDLFSKTVSYNRFVELQQSVVVPLTIFIKDIFSFHCANQRQKQSVTTTFTVDSLRSALFCFLLSCLFYIIKVQPLSWLVQKRERPPNSHHKITPSFLFIANLIQ